jgi:hypothetical protein
MNQNVKNKNKTIRKTKQNKQTNKKTAATTTKQKKQGQYEFTRQMDGTRKYHLE